MKDQTDPTAIQFWGQCLLQSIQFNFLGWKMAIDFSLHIRMELQAFLQMQGKPLWPERCLILFVITQGLKKFPQTLSYPKTTMETLWWHADLIHHWIWITSTWFMLDQTKRWNFGNTKCFRNRFVVVLQNHKMITIILTDKLQNSKSTFSFKNY